MKVGLFRQALLTQAGFDPLVTDRVAKDLQLCSWARHKFLAKQEGTPANTPNMGLLFSCIP
jgi:hypothetical protein